MAIVDAVGSIGEIIAWVGLLVGIPLLSISLLVRRAQGGRIRTPLSIIGDLDDAAVAIWTVGGRTCSRRLTEHEAERVQGASAPLGYVSADDPELMRLDRRAPAERACTTLAIVCLSAAVAGFIASLLPLFVR